MCLYNLLCISCRINVVMNCIEMQFCLMCAHPCKLKLYRLKHRQMHLVPLSIMRRKRAAFFTFLTVFT